MLKHRTTQSGNRPGRRTAQAAVRQLPTVDPIPVNWLLVGGGLVLAATGWAYWPVLVDMVQQWIDVPDYSHGFLVLPLALFFLWSRRSKISAADLQPNLWGAAVLLAVSALRYAASLYFLGPLDAWTLPLWIAGAVLLVFGWRCLWWSLPAVVFLWFMIPLPFSAERLLSLPLQRIATKLSTMVLVTLGQPALSEGNTIWIGDNQLGIEEACSGLRILMGIYALAFAFVLFSSWTWWQKCLVLVAALPIAIISNVTRVVVTGLLYQYSTSEAARHFMHDLSGLVMIPFAAALFWLFLIYLDRLFPEVEELSSLDAARARV
jgi:exosortase